MTVSTRHRESQDCAESGKHWTVIVDDVWLVLESRQPANVAGAVGSQGLWRNAGPDEASLRFELPKRVLVGSGDDDEPFDAVAAALDWASLKLAGSTVANWQPPEPAEVQTWLRPGVLTARSEGVPRQGQLVCGNGRLAVRFEVVRVRPGLNPARRAWLEELIADARRQLRMVRIGLEPVAAQRQGTGPSSLIIEVDFSGAPLPLLEPLVRFGAEAASLAVQWLLAPAVLLCDGGPCQLIDRIPLRQ